MRLKTLLVLITMLLLAAAPVRAMQCEVSCAAVGGVPEHAGMQQVMSDSSAPCAMHRQGLSTAHTGAHQAEARHQFAADDPFASGFAKPVSSACYSDCGMLEAALCRGRSIATSELPPALLLPDSALQTQTAVVVQRRSNPPAPAPTMLADSAFRQHLSAAVSLSTNFRV